LSLTGTWQTFLKYLEYIVKTLEGYSQDVDSQHFRMSLGREKPYDCFEIREQALAMICKIQ